MRKNLIKNKYSEHKNYVSEIFQNSKLDITETFQFIENELFEQNYSQDEEENNLIYLSIAKLGIKYNHPIESIRIKAINIIENKQLNKKYYEENVIKKNKKYLKHLKKKLTKVTITIEEYKKLTNSYEDFSEQRTELKEIIEEISPNNLGISADKTIGVAIDFLKQYKRTE